MTRKIIEGGKNPSASDFFEARYKLAECKRLADIEMAKVDFILTPTAPRNFTLREIEADPIGLNSILGTYTNFMNLLDFSALALPAGLYGGKLPWGVTIFSSAGMDRALLQIGTRYIGNSDTRFADGFDEILIVVCGAHMEGLPLNWQLTQRGGTFVSQMKTDDCYRMYLVPSGQGLPERPALVRVAPGEGAGIACELWTLPTEEFGDFVSKIPPPLGIGKVKMKDGSWHPGFIAEPISKIGAEDLTSFGGWRAYLSGKV